LLPALLCLFWLAAGPGNAGDPGQVTFTTRTGGGGFLLWRMDAVHDSPPENLSTKLNQIAPLPGRHEGPITGAAAGSWCVFRSERFHVDSQGWPGLTVAPPDFSSAETIRAGG